jgi:PAS domain-containing protein
LPNTPEVQVPQQPLELILLRQLASYLAVPIWVADSEGNLIYYNESAEPVLGRRFDEAGEITLAELSGLFEIRDEAGEPLASENIPLGVALLQRHPAHGRLQMRGLDGAWRRIDVTAFPVEGQGGRMLGAAVLFWEIEPA